MLVIVPASQFPALKQEKQRFNVIYMSDTTNILRAVMGASGLVFGIHEQAILMFLLAVTYATGRQAAQIMMYQFEKGLVKKGSASKLAGGLRMTEKTLRKHLGELSEKGFVTIYAAKNEDTGYENDARIFEIDCKKLLNTHEIGGVKNAGGRVVRETPHHRYIHGIAKAILPAVRGSNVLDFSEGKVAMLKTPRKGYYQTPTQTDKPAEVVARIAATAIVRNTARRATAEAKLAHLLTKDEMQAVIDRHMGQYKPNSPRMLVTQREYGFFKKRLEASPPDDLNKFLTWAFVYWADIARQNRKALMKREEIGEKVSSPLPAAPNFPALVYRYPYLLKAYANHGAERAGAPTAELEDNRVKALEGTIARLQQEGKTLRKALVSRKVEPPMTRAERIQKQNDSGLPDWDEPVVHTNAKRA
jgi:hypothetical protein